MRERVSLFYKIDSHFVIKTKIEIVELNLFIIGISHQESHTPKLFVELPTLHKQVQACTMGVL